MRLSLNFIVGLGTLVVLVAGCGSPEPETGQEAFGYRFVAAWGTSGTEPGQFREPIGIAISGDQVFVSDAGNNRIQVLDREGQFLRQFGSDSLQRPMHLALRAGRLYVPAYLNDRVYVFSTEGDLLSSIGAPGTGAGQFDAPAGVAISEGGDLYVADFYNHRVQLLTPEGTMVRAYGTPGQEGTAPGQFTYPTDAALMEDGRLVVGDAYNNRVQVFSEDGEVLWMVPETTTEAGSTQGRFNVATAVEAGPDGRLYVADFFNHRIQAFTADGEFVTSLGSQGTGEGQFERPTDLAFDADGDLYVVDFGNDRVQRFTPTSKGDTP